MSFIKFPSSPEEKGNIVFSSEEIDFCLENEKIIRDWLKEIIEREEKELLSLNFIFCSDEYLYDMNVEYLEHDTFTDVITFPYSAPPIIEGDIFISIDRIKENAKKFKVSFTNELHRVMAHGVLHLCGLGDKSDQEASVMRQKENEALLLIDSYYTL
jgi:rRNA maturation RNase YbeY